MKRILSILLVALMLVGMLPMQAFHAHAAEGKYVKITAAPSDWSGKYLIVYEDGGAVLNGSLSKFDVVKNKVDVTITDNSITATDELNGASFEITTAGNILSSSGYYIGATSNSNSLLCSTSTKYTNTITFNNDGTVSIKGSGGAYLRYNAASDQLRFRYYKSSSYTAQKAICLYKLEESSSGGDTSCTHPSYAETITTAATCTTAGVKTFTCTTEGCNYSYTEEIPATGHNYVDGVCTVCNDELAVVSFSVPSQVDSVDSITADEDTGKVTLPAATESYTGKYNYTFVGWAEKSVSTTETEPTIYEAGSEYSPDGDTTLYAVYSYSDGTSGGASQYVLTDLSVIAPTDVVVVTMTYTDGTIYALSSAIGTSKAPAATIVTATNGVLDNAPADDLKWNIGGNASGYILYVNGSTTTWLYCTDTNNGVRVGTNSANTFVVDSASGYLKHTDTSRYLGVYRTTPDWRCYTNTTGNTANQTLGFYVETSAGATYYTSTLEDAESSHQHTYNAVVTAPTCTETGYTTYTCSCGDSYVDDEVAAKGHTEVVDAAKDPTCVATGLTAGSHCSVCNAVIDAQEIVPATDVHTYVDGVCTGCGAEEPSTGATEWQLVTDASTLKAGDKIVIVAAEADYAMSATQGNNNRSAVAITKSTDAKIVTFGDDVQIITLEAIDGSECLAFDTDEGYLYAASSSKNYLKSQTALDTNGYWLITITEGVATIKAQGSNTNNEIRYNPNNNSPLISCYAATSAMTKVAIYKETVLCDHANIVDVATVPSTCTSVGYTAGKQCQDCGTYTEGHELIEMLDHNWNNGVQTTAPGCTTTGVKTYTCSVCSDTKTETIDANGHSMGEGVVEDATCETDGSKTYTCTVCGENQAETIPALGHSWDEGEITTPATCETDGEMTYTCTRGCTKTEVIKAPGHIYVDGVCSCGKEVSRFEVVEDYAKILSGGEFVIAFKVDDTFYAVDDEVGSNLSSIGVEVTGKGNDMMIEYSEGLPVWTVDYYTHKLGCFSLYSAESGKYLAGSTGPSFSVSAAPWAWTFIDADNNGVQTDRVYAVVEEDTNAQDYGASAFVVASEEIQDRGITYRSGNIANYSIRSGVNQSYYHEVYFFKVVEADTEFYTATFVENGEEVMTTDVAVGESSIITMPEYSGTVDMPTNYTEFVGWVTLPHTESVVAPTTIYEAGKSYPIAEDTTFYALYTREDANADGQAMSYHLVTDNTQLVYGEKYIIVGYSATEGQYYAMSDDQLSGDRGASKVSWNNGIITFTPNDNVAVFQLTEGYTVLEDALTYSFLDLSKNKILYCASSGDNALGTQSEMDANSTFVITIQSEEKGYYSSIVSQTADANDTLLFNTASIAQGQPYRLFSCYEVATTGNDATKTFLYVGVPNDTPGLYYTTGLCNHQWETTIEPATCDHAGYTMNTCSVCGKVEITETVANGHTPGAYEVTTPATCTAAGVQTATCSACGKNFTEAIAPLGHDYVGTAAYVDKIPTITHDCSRCDAVQMIELNFYGSTVYMGNTLAVYYYTDRDIDGIEISETETLPGFTDISVNFSYGERKVHYDEEGNQTNDYSLTVSLDDAIKNNESYYKFPCRYISPSQIGDEITAVISGEFNGTPYEFKMTGYSVKQYCLNRIKASDSTETEQKMLVDMLYYCDASRAYTGYVPTKESDQVSPVSELTDAQKALHTKVRGYTSVLSITSSENVDKKATWVAASVELSGGSVRIRLRCKPVDGVSIGEVTAKAIVNEEAVETYVKQEDGVYYVYVLDLAYAQLSVPVYVTLYEGDTAISDTICYSVESYAATMLDNTNEKLVTLLKAMMCYGDSAKAYFDTKNT